MTPSVVMLKEPSSESDSLSKVWEYKCVAEGVYQGHYLNGGNARELPGNLMFINMGSKYAKWEIIDLDKNIFWQALPERYIESDSKWVPLYEYRANIIDRASLEKLIWKAEKNSAL